MSKSSSPFSFIVDTINVLPNKSQFSGIPHCLEKSFKKLKSVNSATSVTFPLALIFFIESSIPFFISLSPISL